MAPAFATLHPGPDARHYDGAYATYLKRLRAEVLP